MSSLLLANLFWLLSMSTLATQSLPAAEELYEVTLAERLGDEPRGWCIDAAGHQKNAIMAGGLHAHTCYSYEGEGKYRVAEDQGFVKQDIAGKDRFRLGAFGYCMSLSARRANSWIALTPCDDRPEQDFVLTDQGQIKSTMAPELCVTLGTRTVPGGGGTPVHQIRDLRMQRCGEGQAGLQIWRLRNRRDW